MLYNIYCDESCHLLGDSCKSMVIGGLYCPIDDVRNITLDIRNIKKKYFLPEKREVKWIKISKSKQDFYLELIEYFLKHNTLKFRAVKIPDKTILKCEKYNHTYDEFYYITYFNMLKHIIKQSYNNYNIYLDIKDTLGSTKIKKLKDFLEKTIKIKNINRIQEIRSYESEIMQLSDILIGAVGYEDRISQNTKIDKNINLTKLQICDKLKTTLGINFYKTSPFSAEKFSLLVWEGNK